MNRVEIFISNNPLEIKTYIDGFCDRHNYNPINVSITYDRNNRCYVALCVLEERR